MMKEYIEKDGQAHHEKTLAEMTTEDAIIAITVAAKILGSNGFLAAEHRLNIVAEWLQAQQSKEH